MRSFGTWSNSRRAAAARDLYAAAVADYARALGPDDLDTLTTRCMRAQWTETAARVGG
ncbi:hypothetical protein [Streptomyces yangpuensis]|uniref:hypothetical protein n=1 Tax=Streptomyces yangpuensis TaxID=1648182 RepID=UPI003800D6F9